MRNAAAMRELPRRFVVHNTHEQIQLAAMRVVAAKGYHATSVRDICAEAHMSARSFHEHFASTEEAVLTAVEAGVDQVMGACRLAIADTPSWPDRVWEGLENIIDWIIAEPAFARTSIVELLAVGPAAIELLRSLMDSFALGLAPGYELIDTPQAGLLDEPITGRVFELLHTHLTHNSSESVRSLQPELVRTTLTPFLGPQATEELIARRSLPTTEELIAHRSLPTTEQLIARAASRQPRS
jgi:AcrR family transcriptional regulator